MKLAPFLSAAAALVAIPALTLLACSSDDDGEVIGGTDTATSSDVGRLD